MLNIASKGKDDKVRSCLLASETKVLPDSKVSCVPLCSFSDVACDVLEDDLVLSAEEDAGECRHTPLSQHKKTAAKELNFSRLAS